jgi:hypothetical protein
MRNEMRTTILLSLGHVYRRPPVTTEATNHIPSPLAIPDSVSYLRHWFPRTAVKEGSIYYVLPRFSPYKAHIHATQETRATSDRVCKISASAEQKRSHSRR